MMMMSKKNTFLLNKLIKLCKLTYSLSSFLLYFLYNHHHHHLLKARKHILISYLINRIYFHYKFDSLSQGITKKYNQKKKRV